MKARLLTASTAAAALLLASATTASADGPAFPDGSPTVRLLPGEPLAPASSITHRVLAVGVAMKFPDGRTAPVGTSYLIRAYSCGALIKEATQNVVYGDVDYNPFIGLSPDGRPDAKPNPVNNLVGDNKVTLSVQVTEVGYTPYTMTSNITFTGVGGPSCEEVLNPTADPETPETTRVEKWSTKKGNTSAKVGKRLAVTPTRAPGSTVTYIWKVGAKVVDRDRSMTVKKAYQGKKVTMVVTATKPGSKTLQRTLGYGKAR